MAAAQLVQLCIFANFEWFLLCFNTGLLRISLSKVAETLLIHIFFSEKGFCRVYLADTLPNVSRLPKVQRTMTIFKYAKAQLYRLSQTCKLMLAAEDWQRLKDLGIRAAVRGCRAGKKETKQLSTSHIPTRVAQRPSADRVHKGSQHGRGVYTQVANVDSLTSTVSSHKLAAITCKHRSDIKMCLLNPCSVCNKTSVLQDFVTDHNIDLMVLTETWLKGDDRDNVILAELQPLAIQSSTWPARIAVGELPSCTPVLSVLRVKNTQSHLRHSTRILRNCNASYTPCLQSDLPLFTALRNLTPTA